MTTANPNLPVLVELAALRATNARMELSLAREAAVRNETGCQRRLAIAVAERDRAAKRLKTLADELLAE